MKTTTDDSAVLSEAILLTDRRGIQTLAGYCPPISWGELAKCLLDASNDNRVLVGTGFPVNGHPETDGPPGSTFLAMALSQLGRNVALISLPPVLDALEELIDTTKVELIGVKGGTQKRRIEGIPVTVEVCGCTSDGTYRNMRGVDITAEAPWMESVVGQTALISVGDGGNEFGFGSVPNSWFEKFHIRKPVSECQFLIPSEVSNWGALAIVAALQRLTGEILMPTPAAYQTFLESLAKRGLVDGFSGHPTATEDGLEPGAATPVIEALSRWANKEVPAIEENTQRG